MWCDAEFGWGPIVHDTHALTVCFCATVFELPPPILLCCLGFPRFRALLKDHPYINPPPSRRFNVKLGLSCTCLLCALMLTLFVRPESTANTVAQVSVSIGWLFSVIILVSGYLRAQPMVWPLNVWWATQFLSGVVVVANHSTFHPSTPVLLIRALSLLCVASLLTLSIFFYRDETKHYREVTWFTPPGRQSSDGLRNMSGAGGGGEDDTMQRRGRDVSTFDLLDDNDETATIPHQPRIATTTTNPSIISPLFGIQSHTTTTTTTIRPSVPRTIPSQLSQSTLYGAQTSEYRGVLDAWDAALVAASHVSKKTPSFETENTRTLLPRDSSPLLDGHGPINDF